MEEREEEEGCDEISIHESEGSAVIRPREDDVPSFLRRLAIELMAIDCDAVGRRSPSSEPGGSVCDGPIVLIVLGIGVKISSAHRL